MEKHYFDAEVGEVIFTQGEDELDKRNDVHQVILALDLPTHLSVDVEGDMVRLGGNVTTKDVKDKVIRAVGNIKTIAVVEETIICAEE